MKSLFLILSLLVLAATSHSFKVDSKKWSNGQNNQIPINRNHGDAVDEELAEFLPMIREFEKHKEMFEEEQRILKSGGILKKRDDAAEAAATEKIEPEGGWLKTCAGWGAQELCSTIFGAELSEETALNEDIGALPRAAIEYWINYEEKSVTTSCRWQNPLNQTYKSIWRFGIGCTLVEDLTEDEIRKQYIGDQTPPTPLDANLPWPLGEGFFPELAPEGIDLNCIGDVAEDQFSKDVLNTRAIVVIYKGQLVFERYDAPQVHKDNRLLGWSATKSLTQAILGIVVGEGNLDIYKPAPIPEWYEVKDDPRQNITVDMMLRMSAGTKWVGDIGPTTECIFWSDNNCPRVCGLKELVTPPGAEWNYNSGSTYLLSRLAMDFRNEKSIPPQEWYKRKLFYPIGAHSMYIEHQPNGNFLGGAYGYGKARDWARFGLLFLRDGVWIDGNRILPEGWVKYSSTTTPTYESYAAHFWRSPHIDETLYNASGFRNQNVFIFPSHDLVVVRMAMPALVGHPVFRRDRFLNGVLSCLAKKS